MCGQSVKENSSGAIGQRSVNVSGVASNPSEICAAEEYIAVSIIECIFEDESSGQHISGYCVDNSFGFTRTSTELVGDKNCLKFDSNV